MGGNQNKHTAYGNDYVLHEIGSADSKAFSNGHKVAKVRMQRNSLAE